MSGLLEQAKEKICDVYDAVHDTLVGEKPTEEKVAENVKEKVDQAAEKAKDAHKSYDKKTEELQKTYEEKTEELKETYAEKAKQARDMYDEKTDELKDYAQDVKERASELGSFWDSSKTRGLDEEAERLKDCSRHYMNEAGKKLHEAGDRIGTSR
ncbi:hypothetical protein L596_019566 [Steinernema carpocapsae]|uniref:Uncharacterized protein n=1 Tax=Steinernema carpocapsae TaxID=34508 RepID=A0A4U5MQW4_STECR|nr:hypothetical protein L596_019566 [Steinernema carpocapsae]